MVQEDTSEFLNGLLTALEHVMLHQAGNPAKLDNRSKVCYLHNPIVPLGSHFNTALHKYQHDTCTSRWP